MPRFNGSPVRDSLAGRSEDELCYRRSGDDTLVGGRRRDTLARDAAEFAAG